MIKDYTTLNEELFASTNIKDTIFQSLLNKIINGTKFRQNKNNFRECLEKYYNDMFNNNFTEFKYDIQKDEEGSQ